MHVFQTVQEYQKYILEISQLGKREVGFVPTMGALYAGHISLINMSKSQTDITVCSLFVNPTQFNDKKDYDKYPIQIDKDLEMLLEAGCDIVFVPTVEEIYPNGMLEVPAIDLGFLGKTLEAEKRPGHYEGVVQVVKRLLDIVQPDKLFLGQKDFQQCMVLQRLVQVFNLPISVVVCPTLREPDGLAMSSRNVRLSASERMIAVQLSKELFWIKEHITSASIEVLIAEASARLSSIDIIQPEYLVVCKNQTLEPITTYDPDIPTVALVAAKVGDVRLIDNVLIN